MSERSPKKTKEDVFSVDRITQLVELMKAHDLSEIDLRQDEMQIRLRRGAEQVVQAVPPPAAAPAPNPAPAASAPEAAAPAENLIEIKSPMVGTFYRASGPEAPPYVNVGDHVSPETIVCLIEAMKVFNEVPAELAGTITQICVENGEPVEYDQVLFRLKADGG